MLRHRILVSIKEDLIKLTDFPFAYSITGLVLVMVFQTKIDWTNPLEEYLPLLFFVGLIGTIISITDPFGRLTKLLIRIRYMIKDSELDWIIPHVISRRFRQIEEYIDEELSKQEKTITEKNVDSSRKERNLERTPDGLYLEKTLDVDLISLDKKILQYEKLRLEQSLPKNELLSNFKGLFNLGKRIKEDPNIRIGSSYITNSLKTNWINYEIDKLVGNFYFLIILILLIITIADSAYYQIFLDFVNTSENNNSNTTKTSIKNSQLYPELRIPILGICIVSFIGILVLFLYSSLKLSSKLVIVGFYLFTLKGLYVDTELSKDLIDSLNNYLETHDWGMANEYFYSWASQL